MSTPRGLSAEEAAAWARLAATVEPLDPRRRVNPARLAPFPRAAVEDRANPGSAPPAPVAPLRPPTQQGGGLDSHWQRRIDAGAISPDYTLDLHGHTLDQAYDRLMSGLDQARAMGARVVLLVAGRARPADPADRAERRGAIRAKLLDWLAASRHGDAIAAVRKAHLRHGGEGALYLVLRRPGRQ